MISEDDEGLGASMGAILGQFGGLLGRGGESNLDKIIDLSRTRLLTSKCLFTKASVKDKSDYIANHLITSLEKQKKWKNGKGSDGLDLTDFRFEHDSITGFSLLENKALKILHRHMMGKNLEGNAFSSSYSELSGILKFSMESCSPNLSISIVDNLFFHLEEFYLGSKYKKLNEDYLLVESKYDSTRTALDGVMFSIAKFEDRNKDLLNKQDAYKLKRMKTEELRLGAVLAELEKQYQLAQLTIERKSDYMRLIDRPILPLKKSNKGLLYWGVLGLLLGGLLSSLFILFKKIYTDIIHT